MLLFILVLPLCIHSEDSQEPEADIFTPTYCRLDPGEAAILKKSGRVYDQKFDASMARLLENIQSNAAVSEEDFVVTKYAFIQRWKKLFDIHNGNSERNLKGKTEKKQEENNSSDVPSRQETLLEQYRQTIEKMILDHEEPLSKVRVNSYSRNLRASEIREFSRSLQKLVDLIPHSKDLPDVRRTEELIDGIEQISASMSAENEFETSEEKPKQDV